MLYLKKKFFWYLIVTLFMIEFAIKVSPGYLETTLRSDFNLNFTQVAFYSSLYYISYALFQLPAGILIQKFGVKKNFLALLFVFVIGVTITSTTQSFFLLCFSRVLMGIGSAVTFTTLLTLAVEWFDEVHFPFYVGITNLFGMLGPIFLSLILNLYGLSQHWQSVFAVAGAVSGSIMLSLFFIPASNSLQKNANTPTIDLIMQILSKRVFWFYLLVAIIMVLPIALIPEMWGSFYLESYHHIEQDKIPFLIAMVYCGIAVGGPTSGLLSSKFSLKYLLKAGLIFEALSLVLLTMKLNSFLFLPLFFIGFFASTMLLCFSLIRKNFKNATPLSIALFNMVLTIGTTLSQPLTGFLFDIISSSHIGYKFSYLLQFIACINILIVIFFNTLHSRLENTNNS